MKRTRDIKKFIFDNEIPVKVWGTLTFNEHGVL